MNPNILTAITAAVGFLVALWTIPANFDKRNADRFDTLQEQVEAAKETLRAELKAEPAMLRRETAQTRSELRLEIRDMGERRLR